MMEVQRFRNIKLCLKGKRFLDVCLKRNNETKFLTFAGILVKWFQGGVRLQENPHELNESLVNPLKNRAKTAIYKIIYSYGGEHKLAV